MLEMQAERCTCFKQDIRLYVYRMSRGLTTLGMLGIFCIELFGPSHTRDADMALEISQAGRSPMIADAVAESVQAATQNSGERASYGRRCADVLWRSAALDQVGVVFFALDYLLSLLEGQNIPRFIGNPWHGPSLLILQSFRLSFT